MLKTTLIFICFFVNLTCFSDQIANNGKFKSINKEYQNKIVNAIYRLEGADKTLYPYGVRSINTKGNKKLAEQICARTVSNQYIRWQKWGKTNDFLISLADRYCPQVSDYKGNINWKKNIKYLVKD